MESEIEMTKITQNTVLKAGMKVKYDNNECRIFKMSPNYSLGVICIESLNVKIPLRSKESLQELLIDSGSEIIGENAKVVVGDEVSKALKYAKDNGDDIRTMQYFFLHYFDATGSELKERLRDTELILSDIEKALKNGWKIEKPKYWYRVVISKSGYAIVVEDINDGSTPQMAHENNGNHFYSREKAGEVAKRINDILRGEE